MDWGSDGMYGHVDEMTSGRRVDLKDGFETLLAICRVFGLTYDVRRKDECWTARLEDRRSPADFYGGMYPPRPREGSTRMYVSAGHFDRYEAVRSALTMAWDDLNANATAWRTRCAQNPDFAAWFQP